MQHKKSQTTCWPEMSAAVFSTVLSTILSLSKSALGQVDVSIIVIVNINIATNITTATQTSTSTLSPTSTSSSAWAIEHEHNGKPESLVLSLYLFCACSRYTQVLLEHWCHDFKRHCQNSITPSTLWSFSRSQYSYHIIHGHHQNHLHKSVCSGQTLDLGLKTCHSGAATIIEITLLETTRCDHTGHLDLLLLYSGHDVDGWGGDDVVDHSSYLRCLLSSSM